MMRPSRATSAAPLPSTSARPCRRRRSGRPHNAIAAVDGGRRAFSVPEAMPGIAPTFPIDLKVAASVRHGRSKCPSYDGWFGIAHAGKLNMTFACHLGGDIAVAGIKRGLRRITLSMQLRQNFSRGGRSPHQKSGEAGAQREEIAVGTNISLRRSAGYPGCETPPHPGRLRGALSARGYRRNSRSDPSISVVGQHADLAEAVALSAALEPDVLLLDAALPDGPAAVARTRSVAPDARIIAFAVRGTEEDIIAWAQAGVIGYVPSTAAWADLVRLVVDIHDGEQLCTVGWQPTAAPDRRCNGEPR